MHGIISALKRINVNVGDNTINAEWITDFANKCKWASFRLFFYTWTVFSMVTVVGGYLVPFLSSYLLFGSWRFWNYLGIGWRVNIHAYRLFFMMLRGEFLQSVPLTAPPASAPDRTLVRISPEWEHGESCGYCGVCCDILSCPLMDKKTRTCMSYNTFLWRYFNCGRFPTNQKEIEKYKCRKWEMRN